MYPCYQEVDVIAFKAQEIDANDPYLSLIHI